MLSLGLKAQFNGAYTINSGAAASATNYTSFATFAASINVAGVSGPVSVNVSGGPYNEQVEFLAIAGTSATNTITINGNNSILTYSLGTNALPHTLLLSGTDYMTINSLTVQATNTTYAFALHLWNQANNNSFNNCRFESPMNINATKLVPVSLSASQNVATTLGNSGSYNVWSGCTTSGGVRGFVLYGNTSSPYNTGNQILNCNVRDFYAYGIYNYYTQAVVNRGNIIERLNSTVSGTSYGIFLGYGCYPASIEKNRIRRMFDGNLSSSSLMYGIQIGGSGDPNFRNIISNNLVSDITSNGSIYGIYDAGYQYNDLYNNSVVLDNTVSTGGTIYGIASYASNLYTTIKNNLVSIARTGSGTKYCFYLYNNANTNNNILYMNSPSGSNYLVYNPNTGTTYNTLALWQAAGQADANSASGNPSFVNPALYDYTPSNAALNNIGNPGLGITTDINGLTRNLPAPDAGAFEFFNQPCATVTGTNAVVGPTNVVCQSALNNLTLAGSYTVNGLTFTWQSATALIGPYTSIPGATLASYQTPTLAASLFYQVVIGCTFGGSSVTAVAAQVSVATTVTNTVPYFEGFEGISTNKEMPNCSWGRSDLYQCGSRTAFQSAWRAPHTGAKFAEFDASDYVYAQTRYFYTNGILMKAGVTYSAAVWYNTSGSPAWNNFAIMVGPNQTPTGLVQIAIDGSPTNQMYQSLSGTFTVPTTGLYYVALKATEQYYGTQMVWDDLSITIPCQHTMNAAPVVVNGPQMSCAGSPVALSASGAGTYTWTNGPQTSTFTPSPMFNTTYSVIGTNTVSGCSNLVEKLVVVNQLPLISIVAFDNAICPGESITLYGTSGVSYTWSAGPAFTQYITVSPQTTTSYTLLGSNAFGCVGTAIQQVIVNPTPVIAVTGNTYICAGYPTNLSASATGVNNFEWKASDLYLQSPVVSVAPMATTAYTVSGVDANQCKGTAVVVVAVEPCTGLKNINGASNKVSVYPNPNNGVFTVELNNNADKTIEVIDVTGRVVLTAQTANATTEVNINSLSNGVYYIKVKSENTTEVLKVVKQ